VHWIPLVLKVETREEVSTEPKSLKKDKTLEYHEKVAR